MDEEEFSSDTSDDDYMPTDGEAVSEEEDSGLDEIQGDEQTEESAKQQKTSKKNSKKKANKKASDTHGRSRRGGIRLEEGDAPKQAPDQPPDDYNKQLAEQIQVEKVVAKEEQEKKKADSLWDDFMKDVGGNKPKPKAASSGLGALSSVSKPVIKSTKPGQPQKLDKPAENSSQTKVTITKEYDFAGEVVKITKEVDANSKEAKAQLQKQEDQSESKPKAGPSLSAMNMMKRPGGGLGSVLGQINKKQKISTLEKSKLDWNSFKKEEGIDDELGIHNRGKDGYLERMAFLERTDHRQFEIEKNLRLSSSKR